MCSMISNALKFQVVVQQLMRLSCSAKRYRSTGFPSHGAFADRHIAVNSNTENGMLSAMGLKVSILSVLRF